MTPEEKSKHQQAITNQLSSSEISKYPFSNRENDIIIAALHEVAQQTRRETIEKCKSEVKGAILDMGLENGDAINRQFEQALENLKDK